MGAWGLKSFENDDAADWVHELERQGPNLIAQTLSKALDEGDPDDTCCPEAPEACEALAAAEMVAAARTSDHAYLSEAAIPVLAKLTADIVTPANVALAKDAVTRVKTRSELRELWAEAEELDEWFKDVDRLLAQLS